jgi:hypothetical protein
LGNDNSKPFDMDAFAAALVKATTANQPNGADIAAAITQGIAAVQPAKDVEFGEYIMRPGKLEPMLDRPVFQNGQPIQIKGCSQDTIKHLNGLAPGQYLGGAITVAVKGAAPNESVHISYPCSTHDDRLKVYQLVSSFSDMVAKIAREQAEAVTKQ